jgi:DNA-binding CsgD family transcriptional regulator
MAAVEARCKCPINSGLFLRVPQFSKTSRCVPPAVNNEAEDRQRRQDREYLAACKAAGIEPEAPSYRAGSVEDELLDRFALAQDGASKNGSGYQVTRAEPEPLKDLPPEAEAVSRTLDLIIPLKSDVRIFVQTAGRRCLALAWLLGKRPEPLAELARQLGCTRAALSSYVRALEDRTNIHGRGQKAAGTRDTYRANAKRSWKLRKLNTLLADATAE